MATGSRAVFNALGSLSAQLVPSVAKVVFMIGGSAVVLQLVGVTMLVLMPICVILTLSMVQEVSYQPTQRVKMMDGLKLMWGNGPFKRLVMAFMIGSIGLNITTPLTYSLLPTSLAQKIWRSLCCASSIWPIFSRFLSG